MRCSRCGRKQWAYSGTRNVTEEDNVLFWPGNRQIPTSAHLPGGSAEAARGIWAWVEMGPLGHVAVKGQTQPRNTACCS